VTPAITALDRIGLPYDLLTYELDSSRHDEDVGVAAAGALGLEPAVVFKTLVVELDARSLVVAVIPVGAQLNLKALARAAGARSAHMATTEQAERATGYVIGGISPIGQKRRLPTYLASEAACLEAIFVSAGKRGLELGLKPSDLVQITDAKICALIR
jgi:Cys-tRNA(Pro)/Cys-tRNA(Cys) deacylase